jgi:hypothetical protein
VTASATKVVTIRIDAEPESFRAAAFSREPDGSLAFGFSTTCLATNETDFSDWVPCKDYVMEGGIRFDLRLTDASDHVILELRTYGASRDVYLPGHVQWSLSCVGIGKERIHEVP